MITNNTSIGEQTQSAAEFSEVQFARRKQKDIAKALRILCLALETEDDIRNSLASRMAANQQLKTSKERAADGFTIIYVGLNKSAYHVSKLREAIAALKAIRE